MFSVNSRRGGNSASDRVRPATAIRPWAGWVAWFIHIIII